MATKLLNKKNENNCRRGNIRRNNRRLRGIPKELYVPLMFLCHINDLPDSVTSSVHLFADDCLLYRTIKQEDDHQALQKDLKNLEEWANKWGMRFNAKKCYTLSINNSSTRHYELSNHILEEVSDNPYLGLQLSNDLKWSIHINNVCNYSLNISK